MSRKQIKIHTIHFVGIKGVGMTPLAVMAKEAGFSVTGSDVADTYITSEILENAAIVAETGFKKEHIAKADLVITTGAHGGYVNPEVVYAKKQGIPVMTQGEAVGYFMSGELFNRQDMEGISIAGCHGKTTTTAMIATLLAAAGEDPSFVIGTGAIPSLGKSGHYGKGKYFIAEADEYATEPKYDKTPKFLWQHAHIAVVTNIEYDHPDLYPTFASLAAAYKAFIVQVLENRGTVIVCGDDKEIQKIIKNTMGNIISYGYNSSNDYVLDGVESIVGGMEFSASSHGKAIGKYMIPILGEHNVLNALGAMVTGLQVGLTQTQIKDGLILYKGTKRRLEFIGNTEKGARLFDDYAHHPTEIRKTLAGLRERYKESNIICVFQPHTFSRTKLLFDQFKDSFSDADTVILTDIYASQREAFDSTISAKDLTDAISQKQTALYLPNLSDVLQYLQEKQYDTSTIIVAMGAGDVYQVAYELKAK